MTTKMNIAIKNQHHLRAILRGWNEASMAMPPKNKYTDPLLRKCYSYGYKLSCRVIGKAKITIN